MNLELLISNLSSRVKRTVMNGRKYLVAEATLIPGDGVLNGSRGRLYYPSDEVGKDVTVWNGIPMVVYHPQDAQGNHVSARSPEILNESGIGWVFENNFDGKHRSKLYFDEEYTSNYDKKLKPEHKIMPRLERGEPISLSTGLYTDNETIKGVSPHGREYDAIARNYRPDHLAILPDQRGACSIEDGCGVNVINANPEGCNQHTGPGCGGGESKEPISHGGEALRSASYEQLDAHVDGMSKSDAQAAIKKLFGSDRRAKGASLNKMKETIREELYTKKGRMDKGEVIKEMVHGKNDNDDDVPLAELAENYRNTVNEVITGNLSLDDILDCQVECDDDPDCVDDCLDELIGNTGKYGNVQSTTSGKFKKFGAGYGSGDVHEAAQRGGMLFTERDRELGSIARTDTTWVGDLDLWGKARDAASKGYNETDDAYWTVVSHIYGKMGGTEKKPETTIANTEEIDMPQTFNREQVITHLTTNCDCWKGAKDVLNSMTDDRLKKLHANHEAQAKATIIVNKLKEPHTFKVGDTERVLTFNAESGQFVVNEACPECGGNMVDGTCENCGYSAAEESTEAPGEKQKEKTMPPVKNQQRTTTTVANTSRLTPEEQDDIAYARKMRVQHKRGLIRSIVGNSGVTDENQQKQLVATLNKKSEEDLETILSCQPRQQHTNNRQQGDEDTSWFFGNGGGAYTPTYNREFDAEAEAQDVADMTPPTINYEEESKRRSA